MKLSFRERIFIVVFAVNTFLINPPLGLPYYALILAQAIIENRAFYVNYEGIDTVYFNGHFYSALAPGLGFLSVPLTWIGRMLDHFFERKLIKALFAKPGLSGFFATITVTLSSAVATIIFYELLTILKIDQRKAERIALLLMFSTFLWPYSVNLAHHVPAMLFGLLAVYCAIRGVNTGFKLLLVITGFFLGLASVTEYAAGLFLFPLIWYYWKKRQNPLLLCGALIGPFLIGLYNYACFNSPFIIAEQLKYSDISLINRFSTPIWLGLFGLLFSPARGLIFYAPIVILGLFGVKSLYKQWRDEAVLFLLLILSILFLYSCWHDWGGGLSYGPRFLVIILPYFVLPLAFSNLKVNFFTKWLFLILCVTGFFINLVPILTVSVFTTPYEDIFVWQFLTLLPKFMVDPMRFSMYRVLQYFLL
jgi:hypothetical protein